jgi:hypothetical protein
MAISLRSQYPHKFFQIARVSHRLTKRVATTTISLLGITTVVLCQIPASRAQSQVSQLTQTNSLATQIQLTKLVVSGVDKLKNGDYDGAIAVFRQASNNIPKQDNPTTMFASFEQIAVRRRSLSQQTVIVQSSRQEFQRLRFLLFLSNRLTALQNLPSRFAPSQNYRRQA